MSRNQARQLNLWNALRIMRERKMHTVLLQQVKQLNMLILS